MCPAGDAFRAGFAVCLVEAWPLQQCLQFAAAAGALAVSRKGALPSLPTLQEVSAHLQAHADQVDPELLDRVAALGEDGRDTRESLLLLSTARLLVVTLVIGV
jgi:bifunctional ADP-heptose synthase (sugar kinase/adenylyltransferase)